MFRKQGHLFHRCRQCGHGFVFPLPSKDETERHYRTSYNPRFLNAVRLWYEFLARKRTRIISRLYSDKRLGSLIDAGCGYGFFLNEARAQGWQVLGIESVPGPIDFSRHEFGLQIVSGDISESLLKAAEAAFDVVTFWHVLEHIEDPAEVLKAAADRLKVNGHLVLNSPNLDSGIFKLLGRYWSWVYAPGHVQYFSPRSLGSWLETHRFRVVSSETWTEAPNLYFACEESILVALCDLVEKAGIPKLVRYQNRVRNFVHGAHNQQFVQKQMKFVYDHTPFLDRYLVNHHLGHEFLLIAEKLS